VVDGCVKASEVEVCYGRGLASLDGLVAHVDAGFGQTDFESVVSQLMEDMGVVWVNLKCPLVAFDGKAGPFLVLEHFSQGSKCFEMVISVALVGYLNCFLFFANRQLAY
jgi:hypothetical protein